MENLPFVIWMVLYPIGCSIEGYLDAKGRKILGRGRPEDDSYAWASLINIAIWLLVGLRLLN